MERTCKKCGETKPIEGFLKYKNANGIEKHRYRCKKCVLKGALPSIFPEAKSGMRICTRCSEEKDLSMFSSYNGKYRHQCKKCMCLWAKNHTDKEKRAEYRKKNTERIKRTAAEYRKSGKARANWKRWLINNSEKEKNRHRVYGEKNKDKLREKRVEGKIKWISRSKDWQNKYREANRNRIRESSRKYTLKSVKELNESYTKELLKHRGYNINDILKYPELIECQRIITKLKRLANEKCN